MDLSENWGALNRRDRWPRANRRPSTIPGNRAVWKYILLMYLRRICVVRFRVGGAHNKDLDRQTKPALPGADYLNGIALPVRESADECWDISGHRRKGTPAQNGLHYDQNQIIYRETKHEFEPSWFKSPNALSQKLITPEILFVCCWVINDDQNIPCQGRIWVFWNVQESKS
jgi:hypothetical protein